jgi:hypothetical protein
MNLTRIHPELNPSFCCMKQASNYLSYGMANIQQTAYVMLLSLNNTVLLTRYNHVQVLHVVKSFICEFPTVFLQCFINLFLQSSLYVQMNGQLMRCKTQKSRRCVKARQEEEDSLSYDVIIFKFYL